MSLLGIFEIGRLGLLANQIGLQTTAHNISNVSTEGYSRQEVTFEETTPENAKYGQVGTGVKATQIKRVVDQFLENQLLLEKEDYGKLSAKDSLLSRLESIMTNAGGVPINDSMNEFFNSVQDLASIPEGAAERSTLLSKASLMMNSFQIQKDDIDRLRQDIDAKVKGSVEEINSLSATLFELNKRVAEVEMTGQNPNDFRDMRQNTLNELAEKVEIRFFETPNGYVNVFAGSQTLVDAEQYRSLGLKAEPDDNGMSSVGFSDAAGNFTNVGTIITKGELSGLLEVRDQLIPQLSDNMDRLAATLMNEVNKLHSTGFDLDGGTGNNLFTMPQPTAQVDADNTGGAIASVATVDYTAVTLDDYEIQFTGAAAFDVVNTDTGTTLSAGNAYTSGANITFDGITVTVTDTTGVPAAGDVFRISTKKGAASNGAVAITDPRQVAAAQTAAGVPGDNRNALAIKDLQNSKLLGSGSHTFNSYYASVLETVGVQVGKSHQELQVQDMIVEQMQSRRDSISGVSIDEEYTNMIKYQRGYEAAARMIQVTDQLMELIIGLV